ncbi:MAG: class I SAM-dependent methyltransferase [Syntrophomonadaceae bacterium]|nr:class I SAM-dependent methyltransferase [Syntrophomonadaceae bacterium]
MCDNSCVVTETRTGSPGNSEMLEFAAEAGIRYSPRQDRSLALVMEDERVSWVVVWEREGPLLYRGGERFFYHPSMGKNRVSRLRRGESDPLVQAFDLGPGMEVLDCTLGLGADALVISYVVGSTGRVVGIESSSLVAAIVRWGIKKYAKGPVWLQQALDKIEVHAGNHFEVLQSQPSQSFDIVYFDPMFRNPITVSSGISPLRALANPEPLMIEAVQEAQRVARRRVVLKERYQSHEFHRLGFEQVQIGKKSEIAYGIMDITSRHQEG